MTRYGTTMSEALAEVREGFSPKQIKMAIGIASDKRYAGVNMSGAVSAIEKIKRGLADHPQVAAVLKAKNEDTEPQESVEIAQEDVQESVPVYEGKMKELHGYISKGKTAEWIANKMGFNVKDIKSLMDEEDDLEEAFSSWTVTAVKSVNKVKKGDSKTVKAQNVSQALKKSAKAWGDEMLNNVSSTFFKVTKDTSESIEEASKEGTIRIIDLGNRNQDKIRKDLGVDKLPNKGFQVQVMTKGKFVNVSTPYKTMKDAEKVRKSGQHSLGLDEKYDLYHKTFSGAMQHSYEYSKKKFGIEIDPNEIDDKVATGPAKPKTGKTNSYRLKGKDGKKGIQVQVYNTGKSYELNMYKEEVELDEAAQILAHGGKGQYKVTKNGSNIEIKFKGKVVGTAEFDRGSDSFFVSIKGEKGQKSFDDAQAMADYFAKNKITEDTQLKEDVTMSMGWKTTENSFNQLMKALKTGSNLTKTINLTVKVDSDMRKIEKLLSKAYSHWEDIEQQVGMNLQDGVVDSSLEDRKERYERVMSHYRLKEEEEPEKPDSAKDVEKGRDDKKKTRIAQLQLQIAKATETINKINAQEK
jgi:hypothetical protein